MWHTKNAFCREMQFWSHCYTVVSYQALFRLSLYKIPAVYLSGAKNVCFLHDTRLWFPDYQLLLFYSGLLMVYFKQDYNFTRFRGGGVQHFPGGPNLFQGDGGPNANSRNP